MIIKTVICDDNDMARYILKEYMKKLSIEEIEFVGEAEDGLDLIELCKRTCPDLILLDVDMPKLNGIETAKKILEFMPDACFIFITAYPNYSLDAFEVHAADFIVKPVSIERLEKSLRYIIGKVEKLKLRSDLKYVSFFSNYELYTLKESDIIFAERIDRKTIIHTHEKTIELYESLDNLEEKLEKDIFLRVHNSYIINLDHIFQIKKQIGGSYEVTFKSYNKPAYISRRNMLKFNNVLKNVKL